MYRDYICTLNISIYPLFIKNMVRYGKNKYQRVAKP